MANYHSINTCSRLEVCCYRLCAVATDGGQLLTMAALSHGFSVCVCVCVCFVCLFCVCVCVCVCVCEDHKNCVFDITVDYSVFLR